MVAIQRQTKVGKGNGDARSDRKQERMGRVSRENLYTRLHDGGGGESGGKGQREEAVNSPGEQMAGRDNFNNTKMPLTTAANSQKLGVELASRHGKLPAFCTLHRRGKSS